MPSKKKHNYFSASRLAKYIAGGRKKAVIISLFMLIVGTVFCIVYITPQYTAHSVIRIKKNADYKSDTIAGDDFKKQYLTRLNSAALRLEVVKNLNLRSVFYKKDFFYNNELLGKEVPVKLALMKNEALETESFILRKFSRVSFELENNETTNTYRFGQPVTQSGLKFSVLKNSTFLVSEEDLFLKVSGLQKTINELDKAIEITVLAADSSKININVQASSKNKAAFILNNFYQLSFKNQFNLADSKRLGSIQSQLNKLQSYFSAYNKRRAKIKLNREQLYTVPSPPSLNKTEIRKQLNILNSLTPYIQTATSQFSLFPDNYGISDQVLMQLINQMNIIQVEKQEILDEEESTVLISQLSSKIEVLNTAIKTRAAKKKKEYKQLLNPEEEDVKTIATKNTSIELKELERIHQTKLKLLAYLLHKQEEIRGLKNKVNMSGDAFQRSVITYSISKFNYVLYFILAFLTIAFLFVFKLKSIKEDLFIEARAVKDATYIPVLSSISFENGFESANPPLKLDSQIGQQFKEISNLLIEDLANTQEKIIVISAYTKSSGKTFVSTNLANEFALKGKKVVLLDTCLQDYKAQNVLGVKPTLGLSDYVNNESLQASDIIANASLDDSVSFVGSGTLGMATSELFFHSRMAMLILYLKNKFDCVIIKSNNFEDFYYLNNSKNLGISWINVLNENDIKLKHLKKFENFFRLQQAEKKYLLINQSTS